MIDKRYLRIETAAETYDMNVRTLRQMCLAGALKGKAKKVGRLWFIPSSEMKNLFEEECHGRK